MECMLKDRRINLCSHLNIQSLADVVRHGVAD